MALPRWAALCEIQWSQPEKKDYADFLERLLRLTRLYDALGYNYAKHIFDVTADYRVNTKNGTVDIFTGDSLYAGRDGTHGSVAGDGGGVVCQSKRNVSGDGGASLRKQPRSDGKDHFRQIDLQADSR